jgi:hypothetical protein
MEGLSSTWDAYRKPLSASLFSWKYSAKDSFAFARSSTGPFRVNDLDPVDDILRIPLVRADDQQDGLSDVMDAPFGEEGWSHSMDLQTVHAAGIRPVTIS